MQELDEVELLGERDLAHDLGLLLGVAPPEEAHKVHRQVLGQPRDLRRLGKGRLPPRASEFFSIFSVSELAMPSRRWFVAPEMWQLSLRNSSLDVTGSSPPSSSHLRRTLVNLPVMYLSTNGTAALSPSLMLTLVRICARICDQASSASCCAYAFAGRLRPLGELRERAAERVEEDERLGAVLRLAHLLVKIP